MWPRSTSVAATMPDQRNTVWGHVRSNATSSSSLRKEACHDPGHIDVDVYRDARGVELDRNLFRIVVLFGMLSANKLSGWTWLVLACTVVRSGTGSLFRFAS